MSKIHAISAADLELLKKYDTPTICNVVELFDLARARPATWTRASRRAIRSCRRWSVTLAPRRFAPPFRRRSGNVYAGLDQQVAAFAELPGPPVVVFQDLDSPVMSATFGEVMCTTYKAFGAVGLITSGAAAISIRSRR